MNQKFTLNVNGKSHTVDADPDMPLLYALRNDVGLNNPHFGCGLAQCGACTVHLDGAADAFLRDAAVRWSATPRSRRWPASARRKNRTRCKRLTSKSKCRNAATASTAG